MSDLDKKVIVYGATGFTGQLVAEDLVRRGIPLTVAGRNADKLEQLAGRLRDGGGDVEAAAVQHEVGAMTDLFRGKQVVINISGPYNQIGRDVVKAAVEAGCHYVDVTGEQDFMLDTRREFDAVAAQRDLAIIPSNAFHWCPGGCAADIALETRGVDTVEVVYQVNGYMTIASAKSTFRVAKRNHYENRAGRLEEYDYGAMYRTVAIPGSDGKVPASCLGTAENVWFDGDPRVENLQVLRADPVSKVMGRTFGFFQHLQKVIDRDRLDWCTDTLTDRLWKQKPREAAGESAWTVIANGSGPGARSQVVLRGDRPYVMTGILCGESAERILAGDLRRTGFVAPHQAFGAREMIASTARMGVTLEETSSARPAERSDQAVQATA